MSFLKPHHTCLVRAVDPNPALWAAIEYCCLVCWDVRGVHVRSERTGEIVRDWRDGAPEVPLVVLEESDRDPFFAYLDEVLEEGASSVTLVVPRVVAAADAGSDGTLREYLRHCPGLSVMGLDFFPASAAVAAEVKARD
jgi:hypothetical protein